MAGLLTISVTSGSWEGIVSDLFGYNPLCQDYYEACLKQDLEKAKKELEKGAFAENNYTSK